MIPQYICIKLLRPVLRANRSRVCRPSSHDTHPHWPVAIHYLLARRGPLLELSIVASCSLRSLTRPSAAPYERHLRRHHRHKEDVGVERQARHVDNRGRDVASIESRLDFDCAARLRHALTHPRSHLGSGIADIDLAASDVVFATV